MDKLTPEQREALIADMRSFFDQNPAEESFSGDDNDKEENSD